jgi:hypothetical protein
MNATDGTNKRIEEMDMKKFATVLGTAVALSFSSAAMSGVCTKEKLEGRYVIEASSTEDGRFYSANSIYRIFLNKNGMGKVIAAAETLDGPRYGRYLEAEQVHWPIEWDVADDCTGGIVITNGRGINGVFAASGSQQAPVLTGLLKDRSEGIARFRAERVDF